MLPNAYSTPSILLVALLFVHEMLSLVVCNVVCVWQWFDVNVRNNRSDGMLRQSHSVVLFKHSRCINSFIYQLRKKKLWMRRMCVLNASRLLKKALSINSLAGAHWLISTNQTSGCMKWAQLSLSVVSDGSVIELGNSNEPIWLQFWRNLFV